jgi:hypothetical protein
MGVNGGMADYVTRDELIKEMNKLRVEFDDRVDGHRAEIMKAITWWTQTQEKERQKLMAEMTQIEKDRKWTAEVIDLINKKCAADCEGWALIGKQVHEMRVTYAEAREKLERILEDWTQRSALIAAREDFHASRLHRVEERADRLEDRLYHDEKPSPRVAP